FFIFSIVFFDCFFSQIIITEVYYDTPYNEKLHFTKKVNGETTEDLIEAVKHHRGEFVEIYNHSDKDINLKNWYLSDRVGVFWFPEKVIKSEQFMIVAYSTLPNDKTPFSEYFTTTQGKNSQIILQDKIILRNLRETLSLGYRVGENGSLIETSKVRWEFRGSQPINFVHDIWQNPAAFYTVKSIQYNPNYSGDDQSDPDTYGNYTALPNPLEALIKPAKVSYDQTVKKSYLDNYAYLDWSENVKILLEQLCSLNIEKIEQTSSGVFNNGNKCFTYDSSGNRVLATDCSSSTNANSVETGYNGDQLEEIKNAIVIYPNPTQSQVTIKWSGTALNKIYNLQVYSAAGTSVFGYNPSSSTSSVTFSLQNQLPGVFVANFVLNNGQVVSKNILKW
ncbi:lamin tail domain-containing protein, partial [Weeksellaceae bacterium A-14]